MFILVKFNNYLKEQKKTRDKVLDDRKRNVVAMLTMPLSDSEIEIYSSMLRNNLCCVTCTENTIKRYILKNNSELFSKDEYTTYLDLLSPKTKKLN